MQSTTGLGTLHDHHCPGDSHQQPIPEGKRRPSHPGVIPELREEKPGLCDGLLQPTMVLGIDPVQRSTEDPNGHTSGSNTGPMNGSINAFCQPTHHWPPSQGEGPPERLRHSQSMGRRSTGTNHSHGLTTGEQGPKITATTPLQ